MKTGNEAWGSLDPDPPTGREISAMACSRSCALSHLKEVWLAETDTWYCNDCMVDHWIEELSGLALELIGWNGKSDENKLLMRCAFDAECDGNEEFTHFTASLPCSHTPTAEITLAMLEAKRKENSK